MIRPAVVKIANPNIVQIFINNIVLHGFETKKPKSTRRKSGNI